VYTIVNIINMSYLWSTYIWLEWTALTSTIPDNLTGVVWEVMGCQMSQILFSFENYILVTIAAFLCYIYKNLCLHSLLPVIWIIKFLPILSTLPLLYNFRWSIYIATIASNSFFTGITWIVHYLFTLGLILVLLFVLWFHLFNSNT
jgi:hypothetical protein